MKREIRGRLAEAVMARYGGSLEAAEGAGFWDSVQSYLDGIAQAFQGNRDNLKPSVRKILDKTANSTILDIICCRTAIASALDIIVNAARQTSSYKELDAKPDKLFHLYLVIQLTDGSVYRLEKNQDINLIPYKPDPLEEYIEIGAPDLDVTIEEFLGITLSVIGIKNFFNYSATSLNCQRFCYDNIVSNGIQLEAWKKDWILQKVNKLLPSWADKVFNFVTDTANRGNLIIEGYGAGEEDEEIGAAMIYG